MEELLDRLADRYQQAYSRIQIATEQSAIDLWYTFDSFAGDDEDEWNELFYALIAGAALAGAGLMSAYLQAQFDALGLGLEVPSAEIDWLADDFDGWAHSPMLAARVAISEGDDPVGAMAAAATRVSVLSTSAIREAEQRALNDFLDGLTLETEFEYTEVDADGGETTQKAPIRFRRITQDGACGFCRVTADRLYSEKARDASPLGSWHTFCRCTWRQVTPKEAAAWKPQYGGGEWRSVIEERADVPEQERVNG